MTLMDWRARLAPQIDPELRKEPGLSGVNRAVIAAILGLLFLGVLETEMHFWEGYGTWLVALEVVFLVLFAVEYILRLAVARFNPRHRSAWRYARTPAALLDLVVLLTFVTPFLGLEATVFRLLRLARLVRLARIGKYSRAMALLLDALRERSAELVIAVAMALSLMLASATLLWLVEAEAQPQAFGSIPRAMWWAVATLTTVGYGDLVPVTGLGRVLAALTALCGIGIIALPTGILAGAFADALRGARQDERPGRQDGAEAAAAPAPPPQSPPPHSPPAPAQSQLRLNTTLDP